MTGPNLRVLQTSIVSAGGTGNGRDGGSASHQTCVHAPGRGCTAAGRRQWASVKAPGVRREPRSELQEPRRRLAARGARAACCRRGGNARCGCANHPGAPGWFGSWVWCGKGSLGATVWLELWKCSRPEAAPTAARAAGGSGILAATVRRRWCQTRRGQRPRSAGGLAGRTMGPAENHDAHTGLFGRGMGAAGAAGDSP